MHLITARTRLRIADCLRVSLRDFPNVDRCRRRTTERPGRPAPLGSERSAVPEQQRHRLYDLQSVSTRESGCRALQATVDMSLRGHALWGFVPQNIEFMPKDKDFQLSSAARDRNNPIKAQQINLQRSLIDRTIDRFVSQLRGRD
jgi:hypothetical protein